MTENSQTQREYVFHDGFYSVGPAMLSFLRIVATVCVGVAITANWRTFGILSKLIAVGLLVDVLFSPSLTRWREKKDWKAGGQIRPCREWLQVDYGDGCSLHA